MTPGTGKFFPANNYYVHLFNDSYEFMNSENSDDTYFSDIVIRLRNWDDQQPSFRIMVEAADEIERLRKAGDALAEGIRTGRWDDALDAWTEVRDD
jgi:hypothetical protein